MPAPSGPSGPVNVGGSSLGGPRSGGGSGGGSGVRRGTTGSRSTSVTGLSASTAKAVRASEVLGLTPEQEEFQKRLRASGLLSDDGIYLL